MALRAELFPQDTLLPDPRDPVPSLGLHEPHTDTKKTEPSTVPPCPFLTVELVHKHLHELPWLFLQLTLRCIRG